MTNPFRDQEKFMQACDQTVGKKNTDQYHLYLKLIMEEVDELKASMDPEDDLDALIDILVVTVGANIQWVQMPRVHGKKSCAPTLPRLIRTPVKFANVKMAKYSNLRDGHLLI